MVQVDLRVFEKYFANLQINTPHGNEQETCTIKKNSTNYKSQGSRDFFLIARFINFL